MNYTELKEKLGKQNESDWHHMKPTTLKHYKVFRTAKAKSLILRALALSPDHALNIAAAHFILGKGAYAVEDKEVE